MCFFALNRSFYASMPVPPREIKVIVWSQKHDTETPRCNAVNKRVV